MGWGQPHEPRKKVNSNKQSIATVWAEMVAATQLGEVVGITDKHGNDVAVMMSKEMYEEMVRRVEEHQRFFEGEGGLG